MIWFILAIVAAVYLWSIVAVNGNEGCGGDCQQGRYPCNCGVNKPFDKDY